MAADRDFMNSGQLPQTAVLFAASVLAELQSVRFLFVRLTTSR